MRKPKKQTPLEMLGDLAKALDGDDYMDATSPAQRRLVRRTADDVRDELEALVGELTPTTLVSFFVGATFQATAAAQASPVAQVLASLGGKAHSESKAPEAVLTLIVAYLARDLLAGERVP